MSNNDSLLANLNAFKSKVKAGPAPVGPKTANYEVKKREIKKEDSPVPKKIKKPNGEAAPEQSQSLKGTHLSTKLASTGYGIYPRTGRGSSHRANRVLLVAVVRE